MSHGISRVCHDYRDLYTCILHYVVICLVTDNGEEEEEEEEEEEGGAGAGVGRFINRLFSLIKLAWLCEMFHNEKRTNPIFFIIPHTFGPPSPRV